MLKAALANEKPPYSNTDLTVLAMHCTEQEDAAQKVERRMRKSEAALLLETRIGQYFDGVITGSSSYGVWVRIFSPPAEGKLAHSEVEHQVGDKVRVKLIFTNVERGFIDFAASD
jgi:exoribonuclease II